MPVYYKKVQRNSSDAVRFIGEKRNRFSFGVKSKINSAKNDASNGSEFSAIDCNFPLISSARFEQAIGAREEIVDTQYGSLLVAHQGANYREKPVIVTYHDIGLNHVLNFDGFFNLAENKLLLQSFAVLHINAPGQERNGLRLPDSYVYPTMDQLRDQVKQVIDHFNIRSFIGFGAGAGANVLARYALVFPDAVDGLFIVNPSSGSSSWTEWFYQKRNIRSLQNNNRSSLLPMPVQEYFMWYHFGRESEEREEGSSEIMEIYRNFYKGISLNPYNLSLFVESYIKRTALGIARSEKTNTKQRQITCQTVVICGSLSGHVEETVTTNSRLDPKKSTWMKLSGCGMVLEEQPYKVAQAFRLFLQGLGYTLKAYERRRALMSGLSLPCLTNANESAPRLGLGSRRMTILD